MCDTKTLNYWKIADTEYGTSCRDDPHQLYLQNSKHKMFIHITHTSYILLSHIYIYIYIYIYI